MSKQRDALKMFELTLDGLQLIQGYTKLGGDRASIALAAIGAIVDRLQEGLDGKASPETIEAEFKTFKLSISDNDAAIRAEVDKKFDSGGS